MSPIVTWASCIDSRSADWTFAGARLISSASTTWAKIGPFRGMKVPSLGLKTSVPSRSAGSRSGVNWILRKVASIAAANDRTASVFASPGTPSTRTWPPVRIPMRSRSSR